MDEYVILPMVLLVDTLLAAFVGLFLAECSIKTTSGHWALYFVIILWLILGEILILVGGFR